MRTNVSKLSRVTLGGVEFQCVRNHESRPLWWCQCRARTEITDHSVRGWSSPNASKVAIFSSNLYLTKSEPRVRSFGLVQPDTPEFTMEVPERDALAG